MLISGGELSVPSLNVCPKTAACNVEEIWQLKSITLKSVTEVGAKFSARRIALVVQCLLYIHFKQISL